MDIFFVSLAVSGSFLGIAFITWLISMPPDPRHRIGYPDLSDQLGNKKK